MVFRKITILLTVYFVKNTAAENMSRRIKGGHFSNIKQFPHSVVISAESQTVAWRCGASIVNQAILLTAAHCVEGMPDFIVVSVGAEEAFKGSIHLTSEYLMHEKYDTVDLTNDIALIKLKSKLNLGQKVGRVVLMAYPPYNEIGFVAGWGAIDYKKTPNAYLKYISQIIYKREQCHKANEEIEIPVGHLCAVNKYRLGTPLWGDSGSALVVPNYIQVGIVSFIYVDYYNSTVITGYVDTGFFYGWIQDNTRNLFCRNSTNL